MHILVHLFKFGGIVNSNADLYGLLKCLIDLVQLQRCVSNEILNQTFESKFVIEGGIPALVLCFEWILDSGFQIQF